jgi:hypothetical protein
LETMAGMSKGRMPWGRPPRRASGAALLITTEALVTDRPKKDAPPMMPGGGMGGMGGMDY